MAESSSRLSQGPDEKMRAEQGEDIATRARELPDGVEAIPYYRDATDDGVELSTWDHGMVARGHALGQTCDEVTVARDQHERAALAVPER